MKNIAVFLLFGQSNAVGHAMPMDKEDYIDTPLKNVFGLLREHNQSYDTKELIFTGYTSYGMNLAETQDNTYSVANCLAKRWQREIDEGKSLPDLYIIHIAIGSQGLLDMWHPDREKVIIPGILGKVNISMYPLATHVLGLFNEFCAKNSLCPNFVGLHWRGGEQEFRRSVGELEAVGLKELYIRFFKGLRDALGYNTPITLHKMPFKAVLMKDDPTGGMYEAMKYINVLFEELSRELPDVSLFDVTRAPFYDDSQWDFGIFRWDLIHYLGKTNDWVAEEILKEYKEKKFS